MRIEVSFQPALNRFLRSCGVAVRASGVDLILNAIDLTLVVAAILAVGVGFSSVGDCPNGVENDAACVDTNA